VKHRRDIDGLRAFAVVPVVLYHAGLSLASGGFVGVDVFFVISGFLITGIIRSELEKQSFSLLSFYERRARRILPALFFVLAASFLAACLILLPSAFSSFAKSAAATTLFASNFWFWRTAQQGYFDSSIDYLPLLHTWSLAVEEQFYLIFPLLLMALARYRRRTLAVCIAIGSAASFVLAVVSVAHWPHAAFYLAPARAWELGLGAMLTVLPMPDLTGRWRRELVAFTGLVLILGPVVLYNDATPFPGLAALAPCLGAAILLVAGGQGKSATSSLLSWTPLVWIGWISYSLYLWHWPILSFLRLRFQTTELSPLVGTAGVAAAFAMAAFSWAIVERPFRNRGFLRRGQIFVLSGAAMAAVLSTAVLVWMGGGWPQRIPATALAAASARDDVDPRRSQCADRAPSDFCRLGVARSGDADFLLWGDSHAEALFPGMDRAAQTAGLSGIFAASEGCPPLLGVSRGGREFANCASFNQGVIQFLRARSDLSTVVLVSRWAVFETGTRMPGGEDQGAPIELHDDADAAKGAAAFRLGLQRTISAVVATGRRVVIVGDVPEIGWNVPAHLYLNLRWGDPLPAVPTQAAINRRNVGVMAAFQTVADQPGVRIVWLAPLLCKDGCQVTYEGRSAYFDDNHLSAFASREWLSPILEDRVLSGIASASSRSSSEARREAAKTAHH